MGWAETRENMQPWQRVAVSVFTNTAVFALVGSGLAALTGKSVGPPLAGAAAYGVAHGVWRWRRQTRSG